MPPSMFKTAFKNLSITFLIPKTRLKPKSVFRFMYTPKFLAFALTALDLSVVLFSILLLISTKNYGAKLQKEIQLQNIFFIFFKKYQNRYLLNLCFYAFYFVIGIYIIVKNLSFKILRHSIHLRQNIFR